MPKTAYELEREAKIARNRALIEQLDLKNAAASVTGPATKTKASGKPKLPPKPKAKPVQPIKREKRTVDVTPRRVSARLRKSTIDLDETPARKRKREQEEEAQRRREEEERLAEEERAREAKKPRHGELDLETLIGEEWESGALDGLNSRLQAVLQERHPRRTADQDAFVFEKDKSEAAEVAALRERLQNMKIVARAKVTQDRIYSAAYHPDPTTDLIFFGDKHGQLGIWDPRAPLDDAGEEDNVVDQGQRESGKYWRLQVHWPATPKSSISCIKFDPIDAHNVYTSAYDSTVRSLSFTSGISREVFAMEDGLITSMDVPPASHEMWLSDAQGWLTHLDLREDKSKRRTYRLSLQKIGTVSVNPTNPAFILTSSNNRTLKVWDVRKLEKLPVQRNGVLELELQDVMQLDKPFKGGTATLRAECSHNKSVTSAYWDPRGRSIVSTCYDDMLRIWDVSPSFMTKDAPFPHFNPLARIRHNCQTGKWVTLFKAQWSQNPDVYPHFIVGDMDHTLDIFGCKGDRLAKLSDKSKITAAQAVTCSHPNIVERVATGNATGRCVLWAPADPDDAE